VRVLLDTHALLWWASSGGSRLSATARDLIEDSSTVVFVSAASAYEIAVKRRLGRLDLPDEPERYVPGLLERHAFMSLPVEVAHALRAGALPDLHRDPWDRLLVAQAQLEGLPLMTADPAIGRYEVNVIW
jgi:PIN domain nuclease of toxin-antitoxin system